MGCLRPATPGFLVTLVATALLAVVSFCVPYFKSVYFLRANISVSGINGSITFGTLGYCLELSNGTTCSKPSIGYELDINGLVGNKLPVQIPQVVVKWITYALFLHVIALALSAGSAVFGLLAHVREMAMTCCSTFISGFAAAVALIAFIFDIALFFVAKARINAIGSASIGNAVWLTLAAWLLLFFSGCFYTLGRCCVSRRPRNGGGGGWGERGSSKDPKLDAPKDTGYAEQMRLDAVKAEADRKARAKQKEVGLPAFYETQPLTGRVDGDAVYVDDGYNESTNNLSTAAAAAPAAARPPQGGNLYGAGGYVQGAPGNRAMDDYYNVNPETPGPNTYPPQPRRQDSSHTQAPSMYGYGTSTTPQPNMQRQPSGYDHNAGYGQATYSPAPVQQQNLAPPGQQYADPYAAQYGHAGGGSSYHTASSHNQERSGYSQYAPYGGQQQDPYGTQLDPQQYYSPQPQHYAEPAFIANSYGAAAPLPQSSSPPMPARQYPSAFQYNPSASPPLPLQQQYQPERQYTLGGDGYGASSVPPLQGHDVTGAGHYGYGGQSPAPIDTNTGYVQPVHTSPVKGPRAQPVVLAPPEEAPPVYDSGGSNIVGQWGKR